MKIYVASSWKNTHYLDLLQRLRDAGHEPLDWRVGGFGWASAGEVGCTGSTRGRSGKCNIALAVEKSHGAVGVLPHLPQYQSLFWSVYSGQSGSLTHIELRVR